MSTQAIADAARRIKELAVQLTDRRAADLIVHYANVILDAPEIVAPPKMDGARQ